MTVNYVYSCECERLIELPIIYPIITEYLNIKDLKETVCSS